MSAHEISTIGERRHWGTFVLGANFFRFAGAGLEPFMQGAAVLLVFWLMLYWMYKRKVFLRV